STKRRAARRANSGTSAQTNTPGRISRGSISGFAPVPSIEAQQLVGFTRPPTPSGIGVYGATLVFPCIEYRLHESPGSFNAISTVEKSGIPTHAVIQKRSISAAFAGAKSGQIAEIRRDTRQAQFLAGQFYVKADGDAFL